MLVGRSALCLLRSVVDCSLADFMLAAGNVLIELVTRVEFLVTVSADGRAE